MKFKEDTFKQSRGKSHLLDIKCRKCENHICYYQKDGPGNLRRMYTDRIIRNDFSDKELKCKKCGEILGTKITYQSEDRPAYRLYADAVTKKIVPAKTVS